MSSQLCHLGHQQYMHTKITYNKAIASSGALALVILEKSQWGLNINITKKDKTILPQKESSKYSAHGYLNFYYPSIKAILFTPRSKLGSKLVTVPKTQKKPEVDVTEIVLK